MRKHVLCWSQKKYWGVIGGRPLLVDKWERGLISFDLASYVSWRQDQRRNLWNNTHRASGGPRAGDSCGSEEVFSNGEWCIIGSIPLPLKFNFVLSLEMDLQMQKPDQREREIGSADQTNPTRSSGSAERVGIQICADRKEMPGGDKTGRMGEWTMRGRGKGTKGNRPPPIASVFIRPPRATMVVARWFVRSIDFAPRGTDKFIICFAAGRML